ncbi:MAG TPA: hypothetical protein VL306_02375, partial [Methylomirabilota bacterium]|nr:hypothetical protein [Methylomirabilota bacterium]
QCYPSWLTGPSGTPYHNYDISESNNANRWQLAFDSVNKTWALTTNGNYNLYLQPDGTYTSTVNGNSTFARRILITYNTNVPYTSQNPEVIVQSVVGWRDKKCIWSDEDPTIAPANCKVTVEEHLTNWKDYQ